VKLSVAMPPGPRALEYAHLARELGYDRFWLYDSPALYEDVWICLARIAEHVDIDLGTAVLVPSSRHVMTTASAIATLESIAPGRLACAFGTGATARWLLDHRPLPWADVRRYVEQVRVLLEGGVATVDGRRCQMVHHPDWAVARPIDVPLLVAVAGPKGTKIAQELHADGVIAGVIGVTDTDTDIPWRVLMTPGTVLDAGEPATGRRVRAAIGPWYVVQYHGLWELDPSAVRDLPGGAEWLAAVEAERSADELHLAVHEGHITSLMPRDDAILDAAGDALAEIGFVGTSERVRERAEASATNGTTEVMYTPCGDIGRELRTFAEAVLA
jgi:5,10-methylenetetrahydromethanopterin reductase